MWPLVGQLSYLIGSRFNEGGKQYLLSFTMHVFCIYECSYAFIIDNHVTSVYIVAPALSKMIITPLFCDAFSWNFNTILINLCLKTFVSKDFFKLLCFDLKNVIFIRRSWNRKVMAVLLSVARCYTRYNTARAFFALQITPCMWNSKWHTNYVAKNISQRVGDSKCSSQFTFHSITKVPAESL